MDNVLIQTVLWPIVILLVLWAIFELLSSLVSRKQVNDLFYTYSTMLAQSLNTVLQTGAVERAEFMRQSQLEMSTFWQTARTAIALDMLKDLVVAVQKVPEERKT